VAEPVPSPNPVKSIAYKENITVVSIISTRMLMAHGFLHRIFETFDQYETPVDMISTSEVSVSLTIDNTARLAEIRRELEEIAEVQVLPRRAILCLVGDNIRDRPGIAGRVFGALADTNVGMISQGASQLNLSLVVAMEDLEKSVRALHREFFQQLDPALFY
jgi:aspartate kinase